MIHGKTTEYNILKKIILEFKGIFPHNFLHFFILFYLLHYKQTTEPLCKSQITYIVYM